MRKAQEAIAKIKPRLPCLLPLVLVVVLALLVSCSGQAPTTSPELTTPSPELTAPSPEPTIPSPEPTIPSYTDITPEEAYEMINQQDVVVVDLRPQEEYDSGHISDALLIPLSEFESRLDELNPSDHILVYHSCAGCSKKAAQILVDNGFLRVYNLEGGIQQWQAQGFAVTMTEESSCGCH